MAKDSFYRVLAAIAAAALAASLLVLVGGVKPAGAAFSVTDLNDGLVAYYPFNGNANDESGNGHHGTVHGGATLVSDKFGSPNSAYSLDGLDDFIRVSHHPSLNIDPNGFTVGLWVKASPNQFSSDNHYNMIDKSHGGGHQSGWTVQGAKGANDPGGFGFVFCHDTGNGSGSCTPPQLSSAGASGSSILDDQWHCITGTYSTFHSR